MAKTIISEGKTTAEAIEKGLKAIGLPKELEEIKERESAVATHDRIHAKYYSKTTSNGRKVKALEDEYII